MKKLFFGNLLFVIFIFCGCNSSNKKDEIKSEKHTSKTEKDTSNFQMYTMSEGAQLMEQIFAHNAQLRDALLAHKALPPMPENFKTINEVTLTDPSDMDDFYKIHADKFLLAQKNIYQAEDKIKAYNNMVDACIQCHEQKCGGPIARIKTLYIKN